MLSGQLYSLVSKRFNPGDASNVCIRVPRPKSNKKAPVFWEILSIHNPTRQKQWNLKSKYVSFAKKSFISKVCSINIACYIWSLRSKSNNQDNNIFSALKTTYYTLLLRFMHYLQDIVTAKTWTTLCYKFTLLKQHETKVQRTDLYLTTYKY